MSSLAIITTIYNDKKYSSKMLESFLKQTDDNYSHYILEDGSIKEQDSEEIVENYIKQITIRNRKTKVIYIRNSKNEGVNLGHTKLFKMVKEDYFCWFDADDWARDDFIEVINKTIAKKKSIDVFHINSWRYDENGNQYTKSTMHYYSRNSLLSQDQFPAYCLNGQRFWDNFVVKRETYNKINPDYVFFDSKKKQNLWYDAQIIMSLCISRSRFYFIKKPISNIVIRQNSVSRNKNNNNYDLMFDFQKDVVNILIQSLRFEKKDIDFFITIRKEVMNYYRALDLYYKNKIKESLYYYKEYRKYVNKKRLPNNYLNLTNILPYIYHYRKYRFITTPKKLIVSLLKKGEKHE